jgi:hypothetical protein
LLGVPSITWTAGTSDAINFTDHGVSTESLSLTEDASIGVTSPGFDVNSFSSTDQTVDSDHTVDDEPGVSDSGTGATLFHRDEFYQYGNNATGSGSYVAGVGNATYQSTEVAPSVGNDTYTDTNDQSSGYDDSGNPDQLTFNYSDGISVSGSVTNTHSYFDDGTGLALTGESFSGSGGGQEVISSWGADNGVSFSNSSSIPQAWNSSVSLSGEPGPLTNPDGMVGAFPLQLPTLPTLTSFMADPIFPPGWPMASVPGPAGRVQNMYNQMANRMGGAVLTKGANAFLKEVVMMRLQDNNVGGINPKGYGQFMQEKGGIFAFNMGNAKELEKAQEATIKQYESRMGAGWTNVSIKETNVQISYVIDGANQNPKSGNVVVYYKYIVTVTGTNRNGVPDSRDLPLFIKGSTFYDGKLKEMDLAP